MLTTTFLWILLAAIIALLFALFQYRIGSKKSSKQTLIYTALRFLSVFGLLLLLVNPKWTQVTVYEEKPSLAIVVDNSESIKHLGYDSLVMEVLERFRESERLQNNFDVQLFKFGAELSTLDTLSFEENQTNLANVFTSLSSLYKKGVAPTILLSDGNQTFGRDYVYMANEYEQPIYPVAVGDTAKYTDIRVSQINVNRYAYVKNKFPVELFLDYAGTDGEQVSSLQIRRGNSIVYRETVKFSATNRSLVKSILLPADNVGLSRYKVELIPLNGEKNTDNNYRNFAIEVIDQKTNVLLVSNLTHPDIGMFKKSIESNDLRDVTILNARQSTGKINDYQLVILYQPDEQFSEIFTELDRLNKNMIVVTGPNSNWFYLNGTLQNMNREVTGQTQEVQGILNNSFSSFSIPDIGFNDFPPLLGAFGDINFNSEVDVALFQKIGTINTSQPLIAATDLNGRRSVTIFGQGLWKWRAHSFRDTSSFQDFDNFIDKLVQYAASNKRKNRLDISYESFYYGNSDIKLNAQYFDKNYIFDGKAEISVTVVNIESKQEYKAPFLLRGNYYELDLSNLAAGDYSFSVAVKDQNLSRSGTFTIIPFEAELQFLNANVDELNKLTKDGEGEIFVLNDIEALFEQLVNDNRFRPIQKSNQKVVPLIDRKWLLALVALFLAIEWFMRKYQGLT